MWNSTLSAYPPALVLFLCSALSRDVDSVLTAAGGLEPVLGLVQKLVSSTRTDVFGFHLLFSLFGRLVGRGLLEKHLPILMRILMMRMQNLATDRYANWLGAFVGYLMFKLSPTVVMEAVNSSQPALFEMYIRNVFMKHPPLVDDEVVCVKGFAMGCIKLLFDFPMAMGTCLGGVSGWANLAGIAGSCLRSAHAGHCGDCDDTEGGRMCECRGHDEEPLSLSSAFVPLHFCRVPDYFDPEPAISLHSLSAMYSKLLVESLGGMESKISFGVESGLGVAPRHVLAMCEVLQENGVDAAATLRMTQSDIRSLRGASRETALSSSDATS